MADLPEISIIIPIYNVEEYVTECMQSVMRQTYKGKIECILVDDCGKDNSIAVAEKLIEDYTIENQKSKENPISFRILHHEHNRGLSAARNTGTDAATGDYIYYLDSDDYISDDCIEVLSEPLKEREYDMVLGEMSPFGGECDICPISIPNGIVLSKQAIFDAFYGDKPLHVMAWNKLVKKSLFDTNDLAFVEGQLHEDELWTYKCCMAIETLYVQNKITYYYRIRNSGIMGQSTKNLEKRAQSRYVTIDYILAHPAKIEKELRNRILFHFMGYYLILAIQPFKNKWPQYKSLRKRIEYQPLHEWWHGKLTIKDVKHRFAYVLPPFLGYIYLHIRNLKQRIL